MGCGVRVCVRLRVLGPRPRPRPPRAPPPPPHTHTRDTPTPPHPAPYPQNFVPSPPPPTLPALVTTSSLLMRHLRGREQGSNGNMVLASQACSTLGYFLEEGLGECQHCTTVGHMKKGRGREQPLAGLTRCRVWCGCTVGQRRGCPGAGPQRCSLSKQMDMVQVGWQAWAGLSVGQTTSVSAAGTAAC